MVKDKVTKCYQFERMGFINANDEIRDCWYLLIDSDQVLKDWLELNAYKVLDIWNEIKESPAYQAGHCRTEAGNAFKVLLILRAEREAKRNISFVEGINYIEELTSKTVINLYHKFGEVCVNRNGGCRHRILGEGEQLFELVRKDELVFPQSKQLKVNVSQWDGGTHWYVTINGEIYKKFDTEGEAQRLKKKLKLKKGIADD